MFVLCKLNQNISIKAFIANTHLRLINLILIINFHPTVKNSSLMLKSNIRLIDLKQDVFQQNSIKLVESPHSDFKLCRCFKFFFKNQFFKQLLKFSLYVFLTVIILISLSKLQSNVFYSIQYTENIGSNNILRKQIPGIFPSLSSQKQKILGKWKVKMISSQNGPQNLSSLNYEIEFKHIQKKTDTLYITKQNCSGDLKMNWSTYGNNMYLTKYILQDSSSMIIPNYAKDQQCINNGTQKFPKIIQYVTVWTILEQNSESSLFLLIEEPAKIGLKSEREVKKNNHVLILEKISK